MKQKEKRNIYKYNLTYDSYMPFRYLINGEHKLIFAKSRFDAEMLVRMIDGEKEFEKIDFSMKAREILERRLEKYGSYDDELFLAQWEKLKHLRERQN